MVFELASAQRRLGADVEIWTPNALRAGSSEVFDELPICYFSANPLFGLARSFRLRQEIATLPKSAVLHAHNTFNPLDLQVGNAAAEHGIKAFYHPHGALDPALFSDWSPKSLKKRLYIRAFSRPNLNRSAGVFALTPLERNQLARAPGGGYALLPTWISSGPCAGDGRERLVPTRRPSSATRRRSSGKSSPRSSVSATGSHRLRRNARGSGSPGAVRPEPGGSRSASWCPRGARSAGWCGTGMRWCAALSSSPVRQRRRPPLRR